PAPWAAWGTRSAPRCSSRRRRPRRPRTPTWPMPRTVGASPPTSCASRRRRGRSGRSEEHTSELQSRFDLVCRLLLEKKNDTGRAIGQTYRDNAREVELCYGDLLAETVLSERIGGTRSKRASPRDADNEPDVSGVL